MTGIVFLIPIALGLGLLGMVGFIWSLRSNQFDDPQGAAHRILLDDDVTPASEELTKTPMGQG